MNDRRKRLLRLGDLGLRYGVRSEGKALAARRPVTRPASESRRNMSARIRTVSIPTEQPADRS
jgi:hypothetical protein